MLENNVRPTLVVLAAGMGSRYGGLKQMDPFGPSGETIIDYSLYDAIQAGFGKVVFVIREHFRKEFEELFRPKLEERVEVAFVAQELDMLPEGYSVPEGREKPWGTAHAVWVTREVVNEPFAVINADDFYGKDAYKTIAVDLVNTNNENDYSLVGYKLENTLSDHGTVNRGICEVDQDGFLVDVVETIKISKNNQGIISYPIDGGSEGTLSLDTIVSMNFWGFMPSYFQYTEDYFRMFLDKHGQEMKSEFFIPLGISYLIENKIARVKTLECDAEWFGVTYREDKPFVVQKLNQLIARGEYPLILWD